MSSISRQKTYQRGVISEKLAAIWLQLKGYKILERRYKTKLGEIDLIARHQNTIIFIEVKARPTVDLALESITSSMRRRIENTARYYIGHNDVAMCDMRFDVVTVIPFRWRNIIAARFFIHHLDNAWALEA
jgi:putative endonuclease